MRSEASAPTLRSIETIFVQDRARGRVLMLRDTEGIAPSAIVVPPHFAPIIARFDGRHTPAQIAAEVSRSSPEPVTRALVEQLAAELDDAYLMETPRFQARRRAVVRAFTESPVREASHAGGAYHDDPDKLVRYIEAECLARAPGRGKNGAVVGLCSPHMDLWRAPVGYGHAYRALAEGLREEVDTFVLLGTSHAAMDRPFAACAKTFATPLGTLAPDLEAIAALTSASRFDLRADEYLHKGEHSLEFQAVFLRHALGERASSARIVPILCGLGDAQSRGRDPSHDAAAESFIEALQRLVEERAGRVLVIAGADLAHMGPRFGDARPLDDRGRDRLRARDEESIDLALSRDASGFFRQVASDLNTRRVCGLGPIYTMLRVLPTSRGAGLHYEQHVDPDEGSIVSHAAIAFHT